MNRHPDRPALTPILWAAIAALAFAANPIAARTIEVDSRAELIEQLSRATAGTTIRLAAGTYQGGIHLSGLHGQEGKPITLTAADPDNPPVLRGGGNLIQLSSSSHVTLEHLILEDATGNGLNVDDGGSIDTPTHHIVLRGLTVRRIGPRGNRDGIKLSGITDFQVLGCTITDWGDGGSAIDMVGCHRGVIRDCTLRRTDTGASSTGVQCKGGTSGVRIFACRLENAGMRGVNIGGSTGRQFFRPSLAKKDNAEARDIEVAGCTFVGPGAPVAFVGVDGARVHHNTMIRPNPWALRILQETVGDDFLACRKGTFEHNLIVFERGDLRTFANVGSNTQPETFRFASNWWYCTNAPDHSRPQLPTPETDGTYGRDPMLNEDGRVADNSPATEVGAHAWREATP